MRFRPCIDLHQGKVKQIVGSSLAQPGQPRVNFSSNQSAAFFAKKYRQDHLSGGHIIMLGEGNQEAALSALREYPGGLQIGGGLGEEEALFYLEAGASHIIVTSYIFSNGRIHWERLKSLSQKISPSRLVVDLSCKKVGRDYHIATDSWQKTTKEKISPQLIESLSSYCDEFLVHAIDVEGKTSGMDLCLVRQLSRCQNVSLVYAGGISSYQEISELHDISGGKIDYTVGSALDLFGGKTIAYATLINQYHRI